MKDLVVGVDEVGRGCWAGPLVVGAVILGTDITGLADSKRLTKRRRQELHDLIHATAVFANTGWVWPKEVDELGLTLATSLAIERALEGAPAYTRLIIDGSYNYLAHEPRAETMIRADNCIPAVSAASIIAKVQRDEYMVGQAVHYPRFGFDRHVGYGTRLHKAALQSYGVTPLHRITYRPVQACI